MCFQHVPLLLSIFGKYFPSPGDPASYCSNPSLLESSVSDSSLVPAELIAKLDLTGRLPIAGDVKYIFCTKSGPGPISLGVDESILDPATGLPKADVPKHKRLQISH